MSRPKGSKNKPKPFQPQSTKTKRKSIDDVLNEFQNEIKNGVTKTENVVENITLLTSTKTQSINRTPTQDALPIQEPKESVKAPTTLYNDRIVKEDVKDDGVDDSENDGDELVNVDKLVPPISISSTKKIKQTKPVDLCKRCGDILNESPYRIDTIILTGLPDYHREHPRFVKLCRKCCVELSEQVDNWLGNYPKKFTTFGVREDDEM